MRVYFKKKNRSNFLFFKLLLIAGLSLFYSCTLFENDVADFMEKYTETAAIEEHTYSIQPYSDAVGHSCINSKQDFEVELFMRNPKKFEMIPSITFNNLPSNIDTSRVSIEQISFNTLKMFFPQEFLLDADEGKDITASISLYEPLSGRVFAGYEIPLVCDTVPPQILNATIINDGGQRFALAFNMPNAEELAIRHKDIKYIIINNTSYPVSIDTEGNFEISDPAFSTEEKDSYIFLSGKTFKKTNRSVYFNTNDPFVEGDKEYTLILSDSAGLTATSFASTVITRLKAPSVIDFNNIELLDECHDIVPGNEIDPYHFTIKPTTHDHKGNEVGETTTHYALYKGTCSVAKIIEEGTTNNEISFDIPEGTYYLETYATKTNYEQSETAVFNLKVANNAIYVSENGNDETADGTRDLEFATIEKALEELAIRNLSEAAFNIYITGTLHEDISLTTVASKSLTFIRRPSAQKAEIIGSGNSSVITINTDVPIILKDVIVTGGNAENGGGICMAEGTSLTLTTGTKITGNTASAKGSAIYSPENSSLTIQDDVEITQNTLEAGHGAVYAAGDLTMSGAVIIYENECTGNKDSNLYLTDGTVINITGKLETAEKLSKIGIQTQTAPTAQAPIVITNGYGYTDGHNKNVLPGTYFVGSDYGIALSSDGEAIASTNTGTVLDPLNDLRITFTIEAPGKKNSTDYFIAGSSTQANRTIKVIPTIMAGTEDITAAALADTNNPIIWKINLYLGTSIVDGGTFTSSQFVIPASISYEEIYSLHVQASYKGIAFDDDFTLYGYEPE